MVLYAVKFISFQIKNNYLLVCLDMKCNRDFTRTAFQFTGRLSCGYEDNLQEYQGWHSREIEIMKNITGGNAQWEGEPTEDAHQ